MSNEKTDNRLIVDVPVRRIVSINGHTQIITGVKSIDTTGSWLRIECDQGLVLLNPATTLCVIDRKSK